MGTVIPDHRYDNFRTRVYRIIRVYRNRLKLDCKQIILDHQTFRLIQLKFSEWTLARYLNQTYVAFRIKKRYQRTISTDFTMWDWWNCEIVWKYLCAKQLNQLISLVFSELRSFVSADVINRVTSWCDWNLHASKFDLLSNNSQSQKLSAWKFVDRTPTPNDWNTWFVEWTQLESIRNFW